MKTEIRFQADQVCRKFRSVHGDVSALEDVDLTAYSGECVGLTGRSGSGKTTLLTLIGLLDRPDQGNMTVLGKPTQDAKPDELSRRRRGEIGYLFQDAGLIPRSRVLDSVTLPLRYAGMAKEKRLRLAREALESVELGDKSHRRVGELSGGERQRVGLARALALNPKLLVCDEPTAPLDEATSRIVGQTLRAHADRGGCVVVATHDPLLMEMNIFNKTVKLEKGRIAT